MLSSGNFVLYTTTNEIGRIKSISSTSAWVVFSCNNDWDNYQNYTGQQCSLSILEYVDEKLFNSIFRSIGNNQIESVAAKRERRTLAIMAMFVVGVDPDKYDSQEIINALCNILTERVGASYVPEYTADVNTEDIADLFSHDKVIPTERTIEFRENIGFHPNIDNVHS